MITYQEAVDEAEARGSVKERAAVVAWLRAEAAEGWGDQGPGALLAAADAIEAGEHVKPA